MSTHLPDDGQLIRPDINMLHPSPTNPRKSFDAAGLNDLAASIKAQDIMTPILCRVMPESMAQRLNTPAQLEIVAGERRWRAAKIAGLTDVPVLLRDLSDEQVIALQIIENLQRENLNAIDEAEGFGTLQAQGMTGQQIADTVGKKKAYVYAKLKLLALCPEARAMLRNGELQESVALLIARIPLPDMQLNALDAVTARDDYTGEAMTFRKAALHIQDTYTRRLNKAAFDRADATLVPSAGDCTNCPKRLGNNPDAEPAHADVCTDTDCYKAKSEAHNTRLLNLPEGVERVEIPRANPAGTTSWTDYDTAGYRMLTSTCNSDRESPKRSYADYLKAHGLLITQPAIHVDPVTQEVRMLARTTELAALISCTLELAAASAPSSSTPAEPPAATPATPAAKVAKPAAQQAALAPLSPEALAIAADEFALASTLRKACEQNPPLLITWPLTRIIAEALAEKPLPEHTEQDCIALIVKQLAMQAFGAGIDALTQLGQALNIDIDEIRSSIAKPSAPTPTDDGYAVPNEYGVLPVQEAFKFSGNSLKAEIHLALCVDGWRWNTSITTKSGGSSGPIKATQTPVGTRQIAIDHAAGYLLASIKRNEHTAADYDNFTAWLDIATGASTHAPAPRSAHVRYRHPENHAIGWSGHGRKPQWVLDWLAQGKSIEDLCVAGQQAFA